MCDLLNKQNKRLSNPISRLLNLMEDDTSYTAGELLKLLDIKYTETLRATYLNPAITSGLILMTIPDKPTSRNQRYYKV